MHGDQGGRGRIAALAYSKTAVGNLWLSNVADLVVYLVPSALHGVNLRDEDGCTNVQGVDRGWKCGGVAALTGVSLAQGLACDGPDRCMHISYV